MCWSHPFHASAVATTSLLQLQKHSSFKLINPLPFKRYYSWTTRSGSQRASQAIVLERTIADQLNSNLLIAIEDADVVVHPHDWRDLLSCCVAEDSAIVVGLLVLTGGPAGCLARAEIEDRAIRLGDVALGAKGKHQEIGCREWSPVWFNHTPAPRLHIHVSILLNVDSMISAVFTDISWTNWKSKLGYGCKDATTVLHYANVNVIAFFNDLSLGVAVGLIPNWLNRWQMHGWHALSSAAIWYWDSLR